MSFVISPGVIQTPLTAGGVAYGTGTQAKVNSAGTTGQALVSAGASIPTWGAVGANGGGTGQSSLTLNNVILGNGTSPVLFVAPGTSGNVLTSNGTTWTSAPAGNTVKTWSSFTASGSYTVPTGVTSIRVYAFGSGGNGSTGASSGTGAGGGGGGCAFGDLAVTAGQVVTITISAGVATVSYASVTRFTANNGIAASGNTGGAGGSASIDVSVTNGGAYSGGTGGSNGGSGASSGSPLGAGYNGLSSNAAGGAGWGGSTANIGGGGVGGAGSQGGGGAGGAAGSITPDESGGPSRDIWRSFSDPLLAACNAPGTFFTNQVSETVASTTAGPGGGGGGARQNASRESYAGSGGLGGGGGGADAFGGGSNTRAYGGGSTFGGGGGSARGYSIAVGGSALYAGGGGCANLATTRIAGTGGSAIVLIYA